MSEPKEIVWDRAKLERFRHAYHMATKLPRVDDVFQFDGHDFVVGYAKHLIDYLDSLVEEEKPRRQG